MIANQILRSLVALAVLAVLALIVPLAHAQEHANESLTSTIAELDSKVFDAYNRCDLAAFESYFTPSVEFYHDTGGASFDRKTVVDNTSKYICGKVRRELLKPTFVVYPIKDFGAIAEGEHRFCQLDTDTCEGIAKFLMIWRHDGTHWQLTRVVSYGHRALRAEETMAPD